MTAATTVAAAAVAAGREAEAAEAATTTETMTTTTVAAAAVVAGREAEAAGAATTTVTMTIATMTGEARGGDDRDDNSSSRSSRSRAAAGESGGAVRVVKFERSANGVEVVYSNGIKEEIENGRFEQKNAAGRTVVQRPATAQDLARLDGNARNSGITVARGGTGGGALPSDSQARRIEVGRQSVEVDYNTGWKEEISRGRYQLKDPNNNTVVERTATQADVDRLLSLSAR